MGLHRSFWFRLAVSAGLLGLLVWRINIREALETLTEANYLYVIAALPIYSLSKLVDAYRWRLMLRRMGSPPVLGLYGIYLASNLANVLVPLRMGDILRVQAPARRYGLPRGGLTATVFVVESLLDGAVFIILVLIALLFLDVPNLPLGLLWALIGVVAAGLAAALAASRLELGEGWQERGVFARLPEPIRRGAARPVPEFLDGLALLRSPFLGAEALSATFLAWLLETVVFALLGLTFGLDLGFAEYLVIMVTANMIVAMPIAPSNIGPYEVAVAEVTALLGVESALAGGYAIGSHLLIIAWVGVTGLLATAMLGLGLGDLFYLGRGEEEGRRKGEEGETGS